MSPVLTSHGPGPKTKPIGPHPSQDEPMPTLEQAPDPEPEQDAEQTDSEAA